MANLSLSDFAQKGDCGITAIADFIEQTPFCFAERIVQYNDLPSKAEIQEKWENWIEKDNLALSCRKLRIALDRADSWHNLLGEMNAESNNGENKNPCKIKTPRQSKEFDFEAKLEAFLQVNEIEVERQVSTQGKRLDLWIPDQLMIECKAGRVTGDDVCQALDYLATFNRDVLLIGTGLSTAASRGIESANKISKNTKILFVTQEASFGYLKAVCK